MATSARSTGRGPFRAEQVPEGSRYELSEGHAIYCAPTGARGGKANLVGGAVLATDPAVESAGVDVGFSPEPGTLRAPDVSVGGIPDAPGWVKGTPALALEYADTGQDEEELRAKIAELLGAGTRLVWVVRLVGPRRVEVHASGEPARTALAGELLEAPGILQNPVPVEALYDGEAAARAMLRNLLQREGYASLAAVREEGREEGRLAEARAALRRVLRARRLVLGAADEAKIDACASLDDLARWLEAAVTAEDGPNVFR